jgi:hypothetical protein
MSKLKEYSELNEEYQKCLNQYYDKFFDGEDVDFENVCVDILEKMKKTGDFYENMHKKFEDHLQSQLKKEKNK